MTFSSKLQKLRKENNLSQEELARELNVSRQAISKWELGTLPDINNLVRISQYFDCSIDYLINDNSSNVSTSNMENQNTSKTSKNIYLLISSSILTMSILGLLVINLFSILNPAPIVRQASDGSWYVGLTGFIDYHNLYGMVIVLFIGSFISFSMIIFYILNKMSKRKNFLKNTKKCVLSGYMFLMIYGIFCFYEIMTSPSFFISITETITCIFIIIIGIGLIIIGYNKREEL